MFSIIRMDISSVIRTKHNHGNFLENLSEDTDIEELNETGICTNLKPQLGKDSDRKSPIGSMKVLLVEKR